MRKKRTWRSEDRRATEAAGARRVSRTFPTSCRADRKRMAWLMENTAIRQLTPGETVTFTELRGSILRCNLVLLRSRSSVIF